MSNTFSLDILQCPACQSSGLTQTGESLECSQCHQRYEIQDGIPKLLTDLTLATELEGIDYDEHHWIDPTRKDRIYADWDKIFTEHGVEFGEVLEIGSGTGQVTHVLAERFPFSAIHASDISHTFLNSIRESAETATSSKLKYYACDANQLPFRDNTFNLVLGNSVLHHFVNYDQCLRKVYSILKPGGIGVFHEPVIQGKIWIAFFADLMMRIERNTKFGILDEEDMKKLTHMTRHILKDQWIGDKKERLEKMEDKYIFNINRMTELSGEIGFTKMAFTNNADPAPGYRKHLIDHLLMTGIAGPKIERFRFLTNAFEHSFSALLQDELKTPMGYFVFTK